MHILVVGLNHRTAPVDIREKLTFQEQDLAAALQKLQESKSVLESVLLSTCNRTEIYVVADQLHTGRYYTKAFLAEWFELELSSISSYLFVKEDDGAIDHLFRVASGLDSMVLGETQILGQVRNAFAYAQEQKSVGTIFKELFKQAITVAKRAHSEVMINENAVSVSYAAVELAKKIFDELKNKHILIVGAGKMSELTAKHLTSQGVGQITVMNRTYERALKLAQDFHAEPLTMEHLPEILKKADILISSTGAKEYIIDQTLMTEIVKERKGKPLFMVDIAVPRDIDPAAAELEGLFLYDIDDLEGVVEANLADRKEDAMKIELMLEEAMVAFKQWVDTLGVVPVISALRKKALRVQQETLESILRKIPDLTEREQKVISKHTKSIVNQLLKDPILSAKELAGEPEAAHALDYFIQIFNIKEEVEEEKQLQSSKEKKIKEKAANTSTSFAEAPVRT